MLMTLAEITGPIDLGNSKKFARLYSTEDKVDALLRLKRLKVGHWLTYSVTTHIGIRPPADLDKLSAATHRNLGRPRRPSRASNP